MNFLSLPFLFALPLIAVPVIIHLYRGRQRDVIPWGAMQFLAQATTKGRSMQRLEELLLMFLRVAALLALVLALARPMLRSSWFGTDTNREVVLIFDNSLSTARTVDGVSTSDLMIEKAVQYVENLSAGDRVNVMLASAGGQWLTLEGIAADSAGKQAITTLLQEVEPTLGMSNLLDSLQLSASFEPQDSPASREIVVFSDQQAISWQLESTGAWQQLASVIENSAVPISIEVVTIEASETPLYNLAVTQLDASTQLARPKEQVKFTAQITNVGETTAEPTTVKWLVGDETFDSSALRALAVGESTQVTAQLRQEDAGKFAISCRIDAEDEIDLDGEESVVIEVSDQLPILVVYDGDDGEFSKTADQLFTAALGYDGDKAQKWHSVYRPDLISVSELPDISLSNYRAVVMLSFAELPADSLKEVQEFVRSGGGLWVALGDMVDRDTFNRFWYDDGAGISPISLESLVSVEDTNTPEGLIHPPEQQHPATANLANTRQLDIDQARLSEYWQLVHGGNEDRQAWVLLEAGDGSPIVVENIVGEGRVLIQAFPLGLTWTNLPQLKSYVVMIHDWLDYLTAPAMARYNLEPGNAISAPVPQEATIETAKLVNPVGKEVALATSGSEASGLVRYSQTQMPGLYRLTFETNDDTLSMPFYVSRDVRESQSQPLTTEQREQLSKLSGLQFEGNEAVTEQITAKAKQRPRAEPIWGMLLLVLVLLLIGEQLLSGWLARQRGGVAVTT